MKTIHALAAKSSFVVLIFLSFIVKAQLSGSAYLSGQSNHSGIKVRFIAVSPAAISDSCLTAANGSFSKNVAVGVYNVKFSYPGYQEIFYNYYTALALTNTMTLNTQTLLPGTAVYVNGGSVSGYWTNTNVYHILGSISVFPDSVLTIQEGTVIKFGNFYDLAVNGILKAVGTATNRILFTSDLANPAPDDWNNIKIQTAGSVIDYCIFEYAYSGPTADYSTDVTNCILRHLYLAGIREYWSGATIKQVNVTNNEIYDCGGTAIDVSGSNSLSALISCNHIYQDPAGDNGIRSSLNTVTITNNVIQETGTGIIVSGGLIKNNYVHDNVEGLSMASTGAIQVVNNTFVNNSHIGVESYNSYFGNEQFSNNIIVGSATGVSAPSGFNCDHNVLFNNTSNFNNSTTPGLGQVVSNNGHGDPVDSYDNVLADPLFVTGQVPALQTNSPAWNVGNPSVNTNIGANPGFNCSAELATGLSEQRLSAAFTCFPNPSSGVFYMEISTGSQVLIYDVLGNVILNENFSSGKHEINLSSQNSGIYFMTVKQNATVSSVKLIKE